MELAPYAATLGLSIYDTELVRENDQLIYRVYIDKPGGVNLDDCESFSRLISPLLDANEPTSEEYFLEVSSPGVERNLRKPEHFIASVGELIKLKIEGGKSTIYELLAANEQGIIVREKIAPAKPGARVSAKRQAEQEQINISYSKIVRARTILE